MTTKNSVIAKIHEIFPAHIHLINELFEESESFHTLCEDYVECLSVVERLKLDLKTMNRNLLQEYEQLSMELKEEIISRIDRELSE